MAKVLTMHIFPVRVRFLVDHWFSVVFNMFKETSFSSKLIRWLTPSLNKWFVEETLCIKAVISSGYSFSGFQFH